MYKDNKNLITINILIILKYKNIEKYNIPLKKKKKKYLQFPEDNFAWMAWSRKVREPAGRIRVS